MQANDVLQIELCGLCMMSEAAVPVRHPSLSAVGLWWKASATGVMRVAMETKTRSAV